MSYSDATMVNNQAHTDEREDFLKHNHEAYLNQRPFLWEGRFIIGNGKIRYRSKYSIPHHHPPRRRNLGWRGTGQRSLLLLYASIEDLYKARKAATPNQPKNIIPDR